MYYNIICYNKPMNNNYYEDILEKIKSTIEKGDIERALFYLDEELSMPYIPLEIEEKFLELQKECKASKSKESIKLSEEEIYANLNEKASPVKQLTTANYLNNLNIRDYLELVNDFLIGNGEVMAKLLLVNTLMEQDITEELTINKDGLEIDFTPRYIEPIEISDGYEAAMNFFEENLKQNPSVLEMARESLGNECFMYLPLSYDSEEGIILAKEIICDIYDALGDLESKEVFMKEHLTELEKTYLREKALNKA